MLHRSGRGAPGLLAGVAAALTGCLEFSPHALPPDEARNDRAIRRILATPAPEVLRFVVLGDTQLRYDETRAAVDSIAARDDVAFVVQIGDLTHQALLPEFEAMDRILRRLPVPYLVVIGNHELLGNGRAIYERMYGSAETHFDFAGLRFVLFDSNSREARFDGSVPDLGYLRAAVAEEAPAGVPVVLFTHVPPEDRDFDPALRPAYGEAIAGARVAFHGHLHRFETGLFGGVPYFVADAVENRNYLVVTATEGRIRVERVWF